MGEPRSTAAVVHLGRHRQRHCRDPSDLNRQAGKKPGAKFGILEKKGHAGPQSGTNGESAGKLAHSVEAVGQAIISVLVL